MQKKIIAMAVAALASGAALAQTNVTIYGVVDVGFQRNGGSENALTGLTCGGTSAGLACLANAGTTATFGKNKARNAIDSGIQSGSRLGFKGEEAIGGGNKVGFVLETGLGVDQQNAAGIFSTTNRQSFLYAAGGWGTLAAGRQYTPQFNLVTAVDPFGTGTVGDVTEGRGVYAMGALGSAIIRLDNLVAYISPSFGGFNVVAGYTASGIGNEPVVAESASSGAAKIWAINPNYSNGPIMVGLNYHHIKIDDLFSATAGDQTVTDKVWDLGGTYDLGVVKLAGLYGQNKVSAGGGDLKQKQWMLGATVPVGAGSILASYSRSKIDELDTRGSKWALGYTYDFSKRTNLYVAYAKISTNDNAEGMYSTNASFNGLGLLSATNSSTTKAAFGDAYTTGFNVGLRHKF